MSKTKKTHTQGPYSYENWRVSLSGSPPLAAFEHPFFTDAHIFGEITDGLGPYKLLLNSVPELQRTRAYPALILRMEYYLPATVPDYGPGEVNPSSGKREWKIKTDDSRYHGGTMTEEVAALVALCLGVRMKSGGMVREFEYGEDKDPRGRPRGFEGRYDPVLIGGNERLPVLPDVLGTHDLRLAELIESLPNLEPKQAVALIRSARMYQDALWIAETQPHLSWLLLVSALETAANSWRRDKDPAIVRLTADKPELVTLLKENCGEDIISQVAEQISDSLGVTSKFMSFILSFFPPPPEVRPPGVFALDWSQPNIEAAVKQIYRLRSKALHEGIPIPGAMCEPPYSQEQQKYVRVEASPGATKRVRTKVVSYWERPVGLATHMMGATWSAESTPMFLRTFAHISREVLLKWWRSMIA